MAHHVINYLKPGLITYPFIPDQTKYFFSEQINTKPLPIFVCPPKTTNMAIPLSEKIKVFSRESTLVRFYCLLQVTLILFIISKTKSSNVHKRDKSIPVWFWWSGSCYCDNKITLAILKSNWSRQCNGLSIKSWWLFHPT